MEQLYAVVDLETTGPKFESGDRIIQLGCTLIENKKIVAEYSFDINPGKTIPSSITKLTGITNEQVADAPYFEDVAPTIFSLLDGAVFVAHNIGFDYPFLVKSFAELAGITFEAKGIDTVQLAQILLPMEASYRLSDLSESLDLRHDHAHSAGSDAYATAELLLKLLTIINQLPLVTLEECLRYNDYLIGETGMLFEIAFERQKTHKRPLHKKMVIVDGVAIQNPQHTQAYLTEAKEELTALDFYQKLQAKKQLSFRPEQFELLQELSEELTERERSLVFYEATTGVGKTMAYLLAALPLVFKHQQIWLSSSTLLLQEQLINQEIKPLCEQLGLSIPVCSLKGQAHFVKIDKVATLLKEEPFSITQRTAIAVMGLLVWLTTTRTGDINECNRAIYHPDVWRYITTASEDQDGKPLPVSKYDFYQRLLQQVAVSPIVVTNHAYLWQHSCVKSDLVEQVKMKKVLIMDESHKLDSVIQQATTKHFSLKYLNILQEQVMELQFQRMSQHDFNKKPTGLAKVTQLLTRLMMLQQNWISELEELMPATENTYLMTQKEFSTASFNADLVDIASLVQQLQNILTSDNRLKTPNSPHYINEIFMRKMMNYLEQLSFFARDLKELDESAYCGFTIEANHDGVVYLTLDILHLPSDELTKIVQYFTKTIGISATIPRHSLLLDNCQTDFEIISTDKLLKPEEKARMYFLADLKAPDWTDKTRYSEQLAMAISEVITLTKGRVLVLLSSKDILELVYQKLNKQELNRTLLAQGITASNRKLQRRYAADEQAVLLGLSSFWEGFDIGDVTISQVVITKLPFQNPVSLVEKLTKVAFEQSKEQYFTHYALPQMLQSLKQGVGRLRYKQEHGEAAVWLLDGRAVNSSYAPLIQAEVSEYMDIYLGSLEECLAAQRYRQG